MVADVKRAFHAVKHLAGEKTLYLAAAHRADNAGAVPAVVRVCRADAQFIGLVPALFASAFHEFPTFHRSAKL